MLDNQQHTKKTLDTPDKKEGQEAVTLRKDEVIDILKTLEGLKRKLQPLVK